MKKWLVLLFFISTNTSAGDSRLSLNGLFQDEPFKKNLTSEPWYGSDYDGLGAKIGRRTYFYVPLTGDYRGLIIVRRF